eukprot:jgi/Picsp_1/2154/NSC_05619-R1_hypothetical protein CHLNCDRAFT_143713 [Chlorella variabilis]
MKREDGTENNRQQCSKPLLWDIRMTAPRSGRNPGASSSAGDASREAQNTYADQHSPVQKQKAKSFDLKEELERLEASNKQIRNDYENKPLPRPR